MVVLVVMVACVGMVEWFTICVWVGMIGWVVMVELRGMVMWAGLLGGWAWLRGLAYLSRLV